MFWDTTKCKGSTEETGKEKVNERLVSKGKTRKLLNCVEEARRKCFKNLKVLNHSYLTIYM